MRRYQTISPVDQSIYKEGEQQTHQDIENALKQAKQGFLEWKSLLLEERIASVTRFVEILIDQKKQLSEEITWQMGRPISQTPFEIDGFAERAGYMIEIAQEALAPDLPNQKKGFERWIAHEPLGVVVVLSPWNYPWLTSVNAIIPALVAGNVVILKHSFQTPLVAERYSQAAQQAGFPQGVFQHLHLNHELAAVLVAHQDTCGVFFTGSVEGGKVVQKNIVEKFIPCGLELGGKDPAYVCSDANLNQAVASLVDGAFFNSGQSCCGIERIYVEQAIYKEFVECFVEETKAYRLGNPLEEDTNLGPMVKTQAADFVRSQIAQAVHSGATSLIDESHFKNSCAGTPYLAPHVLVNVNHEMAVMQEESFGPVVGIMKVSNDQEALQLMNDSQYGLTASLWTQDVERAKQLGQFLETGTVFMNRCDYLDPALAWTGVKNTGRGVTLSALGYQHLTRPKSYHLKL